MMKKLYLLLISLVTLLPAAGQFVIGPIGGRVTEDEAIACAQASFSGRDVDYYIGSNSSSQWLVFVDEYPLRGWEHPCTYVYVQKNKVNGQIIASMAQSMVPPSGITLTPKIVKNRVTRAPLNVKVPKRNSGEVNSRTYAVILSGGIRPASNYERYWNDCSFIYQTLVNKYQIPKQNMYVTMADGTDPAADMNCGGSFKSSPLDLDFDGSPDLKYAATKANITNIFNELSRKLTENDHLFFYVIDHGGSVDGKNQSYICLWNGEKLQDYELATMLDKINAGSMNIVLGQCNSGGFIDNIQKKGRVISTACTGAQSSWASINIPYDEFVYQWTSAVAGQDAYGNTIVSDNDKNGSVTMDEAFTYARKNDKRSETPMYSSQPLSIGEDLAFNNVPNLIDLYIKDNVEDTGKEPNLTTDISWNSSDVWIRNQKDDIQEHENPYYSDDHPTSFIKVRITNRGTKDYKYTLEPQYLHVYWAKASTGLTLKAWRGKELYNGYVTGEHLRPALINKDIPAGGSIVITVNWALPNDMLGSESDNYTENHHFCLFTRISKDFQDTDEGIYLRYNTVDILRSNKLAQKNLSIIRKDGNSGMNSTIFVRNTMDATRKYTLEVRPRTTADRELFTAAKVNMVFSQPILDAWNRGGSILAGVSYSPSVNPKSFQLQSADSKIKGISLSNNQFEKISFQCNFNPLVIASKKYTIDLIQRDEVTGEIIGGESFVIDPVNLQWQQMNISTKKLTTGKYTLSVDNPEQVTDFTWTDQSGKVLSNSTEVTVSPVRGNNEYKVTAVSKEESTLSEASITLEQAQGIQSATPGTAMDYVDVALKEPAYNDQLSVRIQSATDNQLVVQKNIGKNQSQIRLELDQLPAGVLIIQLIDNNQIIDSSKIMKN